MNPTQIVPPVAYAGKREASTRTGWEVKAHRSHQGTLHSGMRGCSPLRRGPGTWRGQGLLTWIHSQIETLLHSPTKNNRSRLMSASHATIRIGFRIRVRVRVRQDWVSVPMLMPPECHAKGGRTVELNGGLGHLAVALQTQTAHHACPCNMPSAPKYLTELTSSQLSALPALAKLPPAIRLNALDWCISSGTTHKRLRLPPELQVSSSASPFLHPQPSPPRISM